VNLIENLNLLKWAATNHSAHLLFPAQPRPNNLLAAAPSPAWPSAWVADLRDPSVRSHVAFFLLHPFPPFRHRLSHPRAPPWKGRPCDHGRRPGCHPRVPEPHPPFKREPPREPRPRTLAKREFAPCSHRR
jgi:hypothetical protein